MGGGRRAAVLAWTWCQRPAKDLAYSRERRHRLGMTTVARRVARRASTRSARQRPRRPACASLQASGAIQHLAERFLQRLASRREAGVGVRARRLYDALPEGNRGVIVVGGCRVVEPAVRLQQVARDRTGRGVLAEGDQV